MWAITWWLTLYIIARGIIKISTHAHTRARAHIYLYRWNSVLKTCICIYACLKGVTLIKTKQFKQAHPHLRTRMMCTYTVMVVLVHSKVWWLMNGISFAVFARLHPLPPPPTSHIIAAVERNGFLCDTSRVVGIYHQTSAEILFA